jgi:hypothetical protein
VREAVRVGAAGLAVALLTAGCTQTPRSAAAPPTGGAGTSPASSDPFQEPAVPAQEALATALEEVGGGWIAEISIEDADDARDDDRDDDERDDWDDDFEPDVDVWEVVVVAPDRRLHQVSVDMTDGTVVDSRTDD